MILDGRDPSVIERAALALAAGELVAMPTETVYGLGARADDDVAVGKIFSAKGRPADHPLIVHVADADSVREFASHVPPVAVRLVARFWPGPLTIIVPRAAGVATAAAGGQYSIGLRCPSHPVAHALLAEARSAGVPGVAAPSANRFGRISPTTAAHVAGEFGDELMVLDGGPCDVGIESSIVDCTRDHPVLLRPGVLTRAEIEAAAGEPLRDRDEAAPRASGTLEAHYAPTAPLRLMPAGQLQQALQMLTGSTLKLAVYSRVAPSGGIQGLRHRAMPARAAEAAHELFSVLRSFDDEGAQLIWVEEPPATPEWEGVRDRLRRAAASR
ncbi:L-threonylcarbamoyladenylate synthase [Piscinibacter terrae]|uniref:Threonylcarbamoyl-AMP synthase n=1 Tax=Piscinibacter terrae TaxID=2496871 RepID=A0A3N7HWC8_9BURK|nr:L-threonylcarbamoyladenylate synthase [Albitalea terrae]RQP26627.1 threonylcarbamoyl-AMP synthase [Albitalea terrae]